MTSARLELALETAVTMGCFVNSLGGDALRECGSSPTEAHELRPVVRPKARLGSNARARPPGDLVVSKRRTTASIPIPAHGVVGYRVRLVDPDGQTGGEISLRSVDVAGALREVCLHSPDRSAFELWRGERLILKAFRMERELEIIFRPDIQDGPHRGLSGSR